MSATPEFNAEVATGFPAVPMPDYDQTLCVMGGSVGGTYDPRTWGSPADIATEYTAGPAARDARHLLARTSLGLIVQRVETPTPGEYEAIDISAVLGTCVPSVDIAVEPVDEYEGFWLVKDGGTVGTTGITFYESNDGGRNLSSLKKLGVATSLELATEGIKINLDPPEAEYIAYVADLRAETIDHFALTAGSVHGLADGGPYTIDGAPATVTAANVVLIQLLTVAGLHVVKTAGSVHGAADSTAAAALTAALALAVPGEQQTYRAAALAYKAAMFGTGTANSGHTVRISPAVHGAVDGTNLITAPVPPAGTLLAGDVIRVNTIAPAWGNDELAAAFVALADSDHDPSMLLISGRILPANQPTITTGLNILEAAGKRCVVISQARKRTDIESEADWRAALDDEWENALDYRLAVCAGDGLATFTDGVFTRQYARGFSTQAARRLMEIPRFQTAWEVELGRLQDFTISDANGIVIGHDERTSPGLKAAKFWTVYRPASSAIGRVAHLNFDVTRFDVIDRVRSVRVNRITNRMILEEQAVGLSILGKTYDVKRTSATSGILSQAAIDALLPRFTKPIVDGFQSDISDWNASDLIVLGSLVTIDPDTDAFDLVVTVNYTPKLPVGRVSATFAVRLGQ